MSGRVKKWLYAFLFLATFLVLLVDFFPLLIEEFVLPPVLARAGLGDYTISISRLGLNGCSLHITGQPHFSSPVVAGNLRIDWTPSGLMQRRIEKVSSNGLQINLTDLSSGKDSSPVTVKHEKGPAENTYPPIIVEQVTVNNGSLLFSAGERLIYQPFTFSGHRIKGQSPANPKGVINFQVKMHTAGHAVKAILSLDPSAGQLTGKLDSDIDLASLAMATPFFSSTVHDLKGSVLLKVEAAMQLAPFTMGPIEAALVSDNLLVTGNGFSISAQETQPAEVVISGSESQFLVKGTAFQVEGPLRTALDFDTAITSVKNNLQWEGTLELTPEPGLVLHDRVMIKNVPSLRITHTGSRSDGKTSLYLITRHREDYTNGSSFVVQQEAVTAVVEGVEIDGRLTSEQPSGLDALSGTVTFRGRNITVESPQGVVTVPKLAVLVEGSMSPGQDGHKYTARFNMDDMSFKMEKQDLQVQGMQLALPIGWPPEKKSEKGYFHIETIRKSGKDLGNVSAEIVQDEKELQLKGFLQTPLFPEEKISLSASVRALKENTAFAEFAVGLRNGHFSFDNFQPLFPDLDGITGTGNVDAHVDMAVSPCGLSGEADFAFKNGSLTFNDAEAEIDDLSFSLKFPSLPSINTSPKQQFAIGTIRQKKLVVNDVATWFEIESPDSLYIEQISGRWSGGRVYTSSFRLQKDQEEFDLALFCDRLELSSILSQFNLAEAGGQGRLSGRVPLKYSRGKFFVDDGFLFSSPGEKGYLKIKQSKYLETTIPAEVPHFSPLHFAGAALADFEYNWAKLQINSEEENLLLQLQVDGRPKGKLPFRFDAGKNAFVRLADESKGGIDQPIKLDVNFNIPVNDMLQYKDKFMPLFRKLN